MRSRKLGSLAAGLAVVVATVGCDEFENLTDINENPNAPTALAPEFVLPSLIRGMAEHLLGEDNIDMRPASQWVQHIARIQYAFSGRYDLGSDFGARDWGTFYSLSGDPPNGMFVLATQMLYGAQALEPPNPNQVAVAKIMRVLAAHNLTDLYGDVPYFDAVKGGDPDNPVIRPAYDAQADIYDHLFSELADATSMINPGMAGFAGGDLMYAGDMERWRRFGNSLRLRLAMRIAEVNPGKAQSEAAAAVAGGVMEDHSHTAKLQYSAAAPDQNPMWVGFVERPGDYRPAKTTADSMLARGDPRIRFHLDPTVDYQAGRTTVKFRGMPHGYADDRPFDENDPPSRDFFYVSQVGAWHLRPEAPAFFMEYAETLLLQAEAAYRGWIQGSAQDFYQRGVTASMEVYAEDLPADAGAFITPPVAGISQAEIDAYLAHPLVAWDGGQPQLELIYLAYWFQLWDQGVEAFNKYRRTNVPYNVPGIDAFNAKVPQRWPYPRSEQTFNETNVQAAIAAQGGDDAWDGRVWWDVSDQTAGPSM